MTHPTVEVRIIGTIRSPFTDAAGTPIQPTYAETVEGEVIVDPEFEPALSDIEGFERIWLVYWLHRMPGAKLRVLPYRDTREHGVFATRSPCRPNPIGLSAVRLLGRKGNVLRVRGIDMLDGTPILDIKPYVPEFDAHAPSRAGWFETCAVDRRVADGRFHGCPKEGPPEGEEPCREPGPARDGGSLR